MRDLTTLDRWRRTAPDVARNTGGIGDQTCGLFEMPSPTDGGTLRIIAAAADGWDRISVSRRNRCPDWSEMAHVAAVFLKDDEVAMLLHMPAHEQARRRSYCLDWWRPHDGEILRPPPIIVGGMDADLLPEYSAEAMFMETLR